MLFCEINYSYFEENIQISFWLLVDIESLTMEFQVTTRPDLIN